ncbi:hypothetical protein P8452_68562 [Trifolium repens]|nr:hypothetical protein P8452_68562 [Trifolium repens]
MRNCCGWLQLRFISLELNDPLTPITEPFFMVDHKRNYQTPVTVADPNEFGLFKWDQDSQCDLEIPREATEVHLVLWNQLDGSRWGLCRLYVSELTNGSLGLEVTRPVVELYQENFDGGRLTIAYEFSETVYNTYRKFSLTSSFVALAVKPDVAVEGGSYYPIVDDFCYGNYTKNGIGPYEYLLDHGQGFDWNFWPNDLTAAGFEALELGRFSESTQDRVKIAIHYADDTIFATGELQFSTLDEDSNGVTRLIPLYRDNDEVGRLFILTEIVVEETFEKASGYVGATSSDEEDGDL